MVYDIVLLFLIYMELNFKQCEVSIYEWKLIIITLLCRIFLQNLLLFQLVKKYPGFMEPKGLLSRSEKTASGPYPEPDESSPHPRTLFHFNIILWTIEVRGFHSRLDMGIFLFSTASRQVLVLTQPPIQWVPGALSPR